MKTGTEIICPHCGEDSFASKKTVMDGWRKVGDIFVCASCGAKLADIDDEPAECGTVKSKSPGLSALAGALGVEETEKPTIELAEDEKRFCRDCVHFISHPFLDRCSLWEKDVAPMDDCAEFKPKQNS